MNREQYHEYLRSDAWKEKRRLVIKRCGNTCEDCHLIPVEQVHHLHYRNVGNEELDDLVGLCAECHAERHGLERPFGLDGTEDKDALYQKLPIFDLRDMYSRIAFQMSQVRPPQGLTTGHVMLDHVTNGFRPGMVTVLGAGTSCGKSSYAIMVQQENWKRNGARSIIVSVEDSELTYSKRVVSALTGVHATRIRDHRCNAHDLGVIEKMLPDIPSYPFLMCANRMTAEDVARVLPRVVEAFDIKLVIFDYIQRFKTKRSFSGDRRNQVTYACETLIDCVKQMKIPGIVLSQLKRTNNEEPNMDDLKESGDLENMADHVFLMWRKENPPDDDYNATYTRYIKVPKNKDGPVSTKGIEMRFNDRTAAFEAVIGEVYDEPDPYNDYNDYDLDRYDTM